jgi:alpha-beta hydrolase superfamily lysophospholipase
VLAVVHGYGEHSARYHLLAGEVVPRGLAVYTFDLRGHGRSGGRRGHIRGFSDYLDDVALFLAAVRREQPQVPLFLTGHSLGGLIAARCAEVDAGLSAAGVAGLILSSPFLRVRLPVSPLKLAAARVLSRVAPAVDIGNPLRVEDLSHDPEVLAGTSADTLNHRVATARWAVETLSAQGAALVEAGRLRLPLLLLYAGDDRIADPGASEELFAAAASADKTAHRYDGLFHEIFNEVGREQVAADLAAWVDERLTAGA